MGRCRGFTFTWNNYSEEHVTHLTQQVFPDCKYWAAQEEICPTTGTPHIQGYLYFKNARTFDSVRKFYLKELCHVETARAKPGNTYCLKETSRKEDGRQWANLPTAKAPGPKPSARSKDPLEGKTLYPWQSEVLELLAKPVDERKVHWYWEPKGCSGKTTLAVHVCMKYGAKALYICGKSADMKYAIAECKVKPSICIFDFVRTSENYISYQGIEEVKNGIFFSGKYKGGMVMFDQPHVIVFANCPPNLEKMSRDRWDIRKIPNLPNGSALHTPQGGVGSCGPTLRVSSADPSAKGRTDRPDNLESLVSDFSLDELLTRPCKGDGNESPPPA